MKHHEDNQLLTTEEVAGYLNVSEQTIYRWCRTSKIPHFNLNSTYRFGLKDIDDWLKSKHCRPQTPPAPPQVEGRDSAQA